MSVLGGAASILIVVAAPLVIGGAAVLVRMIWRAVNSRRRKFQ